LENNPRCFFYNRKLTWFTGGHAYQLALDRRTLRRDDTLKAFHELMKQHTEAGSITRQETVSMIPPVVLDVQPHHRVREGGLMLGGGGNIQTQKGCMCVCVC
jgi:hypothetical protein